MLTNGRVRQSNSLSKHLSSLDLSFRDLRHSDVQNLGRKCKGPCRKSARRARGHWRALARKARGASIQSAEASELESEPSYVSVPM